MNTYICYYNGKEAVVHAETSYKAQLLGAAALRAKKDWQVTVVLYALEDKVVEHSASEF